jgi:glycosyltransferase involved in cell wall biosynthesis
MDHAIVFACPFPRGHITGGIRTTYRHAEWLAEAGADASVFSPDGHPSWFRSRARVNDSGRLAVGPRDIVVLGETLDDVTIRFLGLAARKEMFCQNQFYVFGRHAALRSHAELGISRIYGSSRAIQDFFARVYGSPAIDIVPYAVDPSLFRPAEKTLQIAYVPRKLPFEAGFIRTAFQIRFPALRHVPFVAIEGRSEEETAAIMGRSAVLLALGHLDSFGLPAIEAMASGCAVVGLHGTGGLEFATPANGRWFHHGQLVDCVEALGEVVGALSDGEAWVREMIEAGRRTARRYTPDAARGALLGHFGLGAPEA